MARGLGNLMNLYGNEIPGEVTHSTKICRILIRDRNHNYCRIWFILPTCKVGKLVYNSMVIHHYYYFKFIPNTPKI
ncbi:hypothetical protein CISIN_1g041520mg [Citrus sinensis]|uniref:Uncharacterized protein n=1 Tax=Citrus sinensis TaxID=2711 RepID=A0A067DIN0_CITSI|nr:hypothetical protein CISIN_1g041520mg [Citrus sinensis]